MRVSPPELLALGVVRPLPVTHILLVMVFMHNLLNLLGRDVTTCTRRLRNFVDAQRQDILSLDEAYINAQRVRNVRLHVS